MRLDDTEPKPDELPAEEQTDFADAFSARSENEEAEAPPLKDDEPAGADKAPVAAAPAAAQNGSGFDPFDGMTPEQKSYWGKVQHSDQSQRGRVAALTRKMQTVAAQPAPQAQPAKADDNADDGKANEGDDLAAKWESAKTAAGEYPDAVGPFVDILTVMQSQIADLSSKVQPIAEDRSAEELTNAYRTLEAAHPDYRDIAADPSWTAWIASQPDEIQTLANSFDPNHVSSTLRLFKLEREQAAGQTADDATEAKRKRQMEGNRDVRSTGVPSATGVPNDFSAAFGARAKAKA